MTGITIPPPPANLEAEQALLGAILLDKCVYARLAGRISSDHFADPLHGRIFEVAARLIEGGHIADPVAVRDALTPAELEEMGGAVYLAQLIEAADGEAEAVDHGDAIRDAWQRRQDDAGLIPILLHPHECRLLGDALDREAEMARQAGQQERGDLIEARAFAFRQWGNARS